MNAFPLTPFLTMLAQDGIRVTLNDYDRISLALNTGGEWTLNRLRGVLIALLAQSAEQEERLLRRFNSFFEVDLKTGGRTALDLDRALDDLRSVAKRAPLPEPDQKKNVAHLAPVPYSRKEPAHKLRSFWVRLKTRLTIWHAVALALLIALVVTSFFVFRSRPIPTPQPPSPPDDGAIAEPEPPPPSEFPTSFKVTDIQTTPLPVPRDWKDAAALFAAAGIPLFAVGVFTWLRRRGDPVKTPYWDTTGRRHFPLSAIGGKPTARLDAVTLSHLSDSLGYFQSEMLSRRLDIRGSVEQTTRNGGMPALIFHRRKQLRTVYVLEDGHAQPLAWNSVSQELAEGLRKRGINVAYGKFYGPPTKFYLDDGFIERLEDIEKNRSDYLLLIFSDSKCFQHRRDTFVLESLARWPMIAWMELREQRAWDESTALIARYRIPVYTASPEGLSAAMERFLAEIAPQKDFAEGALRWRGAPAYVEHYLHQHVERLLGDALLWAQACSMIQPITQALADGLRLKFQPQVPPERIDRLLSLPGTTRSISGLRFSIPVLSVLRSGFAIRWEDGKQKEILQFIIDEIRKVEPDDKESPAYLAWEWTVERVRLELAPDDALQRIAELERTPLSEAIRADLRYAMLPDTHRSEADFISPKLVPLRTKPESQQAKRHLARLAENISEQSLSMDEDRGVRLRPVRTGKMLKELLSRLRRLAGRYLDAMFHFPEPVPARDGSGISISPRKLAFNNAKRGKLYTRRITIKANENVWLTGRVHSADEWISIKPDASRERRPASRGEQFGASSAIIDTGDQQSRKPERRFEVTVDTKNLLAGPHSGAVIVSLSDGDREIPVSAIVVESFFERCKYWWKNNRPSRPLRFALATLVVTLGCVSLYRTLPANWVNRIYNRPPVLEDIKQLEGISSDASGIVLDVIATDADGDSIQYAWEYDRSTGSSTDETFFLPIDTHSFGPNFF